MSTTKWLLTVTAFAFISGTGFVAAQQDPLPPAPAEKIAPEIDHGVDAPASPGVSSGVVTDGGTRFERKRAGVGEGSRTGELQENQGRSETAGQTHSRELNRVANDKKSGVKQ